MAIQLCPDCGKSVSTDARACPSCGYPITGKRRRRAASNYLMGCLVLFVASFILLVLIGLLAKHEQSNTAPSSTADCDLPHATKVVSEAERIGVIAGLKKLDVYVTGNWSQLSIDAKESLDEAVQCMLMGGKGGRIVAVRYKDVQTGKVVARSDHRLRVE